MNNIKSCVSVNKSFSFTIHLNNICNFKCSYCVAGREFSNDSLSIDIITKIIKIIKKISNKYKKTNLNVCITGGEPTLHKDFVYLIIELSNIENINIQISTNGLILGKILNKLININKKNIKFKISFHYFEYVDKINDFIKSLILLKYYDYYFEVKFLLPNNYEKLEDFLKIRDLIIKQSNLELLDYNYYFIVDFNGEVSGTYDRSIVDFYYFIENNKNYNTEDKTLEIKYNNGEFKYYNSEEVKSLGLNNFKGFECFYISEKGISIHISEKGEVIMGPCRILDSLRYSLDDLDSILLLGYKKILCSEKVCVSGLYFPKYKSTNYNKIKGLEYILNNSLKKVITDIKIEDIQISLGQIVVIIFKLDNYYINLIVEKKRVNEKYSFYKNSIGYNLRIKDINNIVYRLDDLDIHIINLISRNIKLISILDNIFFKIL